MEKNLESEMPVKKIKWVKDKGRYSAVTDTHHFRIIKTADGWWHWYFDGINSNLGAYADGDEKTLAKAKEEAERAAQPNSILFLEEIAPHPNG